MVGKSLVKISDVSSLSISTEVSVPASIDKTATLLDGVGNLLSARHWGTAAIVWAWTKDQLGRHNFGKKLPKPTFPR